MKILVAGQKGGVGKSTIVRALAVALLEAGYGTCVLDYDDGQSTVAEWAADRKANGIKPIVEVSTPAENSECPVQIMDSPGWTAEHTWMLAQISDVIVLPSGPSTSDDLTPTIKLAFELEAKGYPPERILLVLNRIHNNDQAQRARDFLADSELTAVHGDIRESTHAASLHDVGKTILDIPTNRDQQKAAQCIQSLVDRIEALGNREAEIDWKSARLAT